MAAELEVEFSVQKIDLINHYRQAETQNISHPKSSQKIAHYVQNKSKVSRKVRVAVSESSDPVSAAISHTRCNCINFS